MIIPSDRDYKRARRVKQGKGRVPVLFRQLSDWISAEYEVNVLLSRYDYVKLSKAPRLSIVLDTRKDYYKFIVPGTANFDHDKQDAVAAKFTDLLKDRPESDKKKYKLEDLFVIFEAFEPIAREEANNNVSEKAIKCIAEEYENVWLIFRLFGEATIFFYTEEQRESALADGTVKRIADEYFEILKPHDEFDYIKKEKFALLTDSKQNFNDNYNGSWFYYTR